MNISCADFAFRNPLRLNYQRQTEMVMISSHPEASDISD